MKRTKNTWPFPGPPYQIPFACPVYILHFTSAPSTDSQSAGGGTQEWVGGVVVFGYALGIKLFPMDREEYERRLRRRKARSNAHHPLVSVLSRRLRPFQQAEVSNWLRTQLLISLNFERFKTSESVTRIVLCSIYLWRVPGAVSCRHTAELATSLRTPLFFARAKRWQRRVTARGRLRLLKRCSN